MSYELRPAACDRTACAGWYAALRPRALRPGKPPAPFTVRLKPDTTSCHAERALDRRRRRRSISGRVRKAELRAQPESGRRDSSARLPSTRSRCREVFRCFDPR